MRLDHPQLPEHDLADGWPSATYTGLALLVGLILSASASIAVAQLALGNPEFPTGDVWPSTSTRIDATQQPAPGMANAADIPTGDVWQSPDGQSTRAPGIERNCTLSKPAVISCRGASTAGLIKTAGRLARNTLVLTAEPWEREAA